MSGKVSFSSALKYVVHDPTSVFEYFSESRKLKENRIFPFTAPQGAKFFIEFGQLLNFQFGYEAVKQINDDAVIELRNRVSHVLASDDFHNLP